MTTNEDIYTPNAKQLELLRLFYRFRFLTSNHLTIMLDIKLTNPNQIHQRLKILLDKNYIGRNYDGKYKIHGKPAEYYLLENGIKALKQFMRDKCDDKVLHNIYGDKNAKPSSIVQYLKVCTVYCCLKGRYGDSLRFFTKSQIALYEYFPKQKPEALIRLEVDGEHEEFFLEIIDPIKPFFGYVGKVRRYIEYSDDGTWRDETNTKLPKILVVGDIVGTEIRFQKQAGRLIRKHYDEEPKIYTTNMEKLRTITPGYDRVWRDVEEPVQVLALHEIQ
ncbi:MAG TPA: replication-relaxation family protein [Patescibacteria group bacterium]|nr:replication-relaxation family protein [Patescibacteria group bacterium]